MTPRELTRLQTFPDDFIFTGSKKDILDTNWECCTLFIWEDISH